jgi:hypothetical protein
MPIDKYNFGILKKLNLDFLSKILRPENINAVLAFITFGKRDHHFHLHLPKTITLIPTKSDRNFKV